VKQARTNVQGMVFDIQRYSLHDGPGIRTLVFMKGCPLRCLWCANPESQQPKLEQMDGEQVGRVMTVEEVLAVVSKDKAFYDRSGGGMTLSGGEPTAQPDFSAALVEEAKNMGIHTAVETAGYGPWEFLWKVAKKADLILLDIKIMDPELHEKYTGVSNDLILANAVQVSKMNKRVVGRVPVVPKHNDYWDNLAETAKFCKKAGLEALHLLPYHRLGEGKYKKLGRKYKLTDVLPPSREELRLTAAKLQDEFGIPVVVI